MYQTQINAAWRNMDMPGQIRPNETGQPPLALDLYYLLTAYERDDGDPSVMAHRLLGRAMRVLHDHPVLGADEIRAALANNDLADQIERIRITPQTMSVDEFLEVVDNVSGRLSHLDRLSRLRRADRQHAAFAHAFACPHSRRERHWCGRATEFDSALSHPHRC